MSDKIIQILEDELKPLKLELEDKEKVRTTGLCDVEEKLIEKIGLVEEELACLIFTPETCHKIGNVFRDEMKRGILTKPSSLQMSNTYVSELPDGTEEGKFLAVDLGGTNFRVLLVEFKSGQMIDVQSKYYHISDGLRIGSGEELFDYLAESVYDFLGRKQLKGQSIPLGFTFSFPMMQHSLGSGTLIRWTKSFNCSGVEGKDVVKLLNESLCRKGCYDVSVHAVLNDTTGTLLMGTYMERNTSIGLILGTGCNACYLEKLEKVGLRETKRHGVEVVIDVEWGAFGDNGVLDFIRTDFDVEVDENSLLVNSFTFEKYISGNYLGEIARVVLVALVNKGLLFEGNLTEALNRNGSFSSATVSTIEECAINNAQRDVLQLIETFGVRNCTEDDVIIVQHVCHVVSNRSALLVSICLAQLINWIDKPEVTIAVDGSLYRKHPRYQSLMDKYVNLFTRKKFKMVEVIDGSGRGAALAAAIALRQEDRYGHL